MINPDSKLKKSSLIKNELEELNQIITKYQNLDYSKDKLKNIILKNILNIIFEK